MLSSTKRPASDGKVVVHIGLPKTATTTLQIDVFEAVSGDTIRYVGVLQPREQRQQSNIYQAIFEAVHCGAHIQKTRDLFFSMLDQRQTVVISEELFTVSTDEASWREKLRRLGCLLSGLNYEIIVTVREPAQALFSYYCELYPIFAARWDSFLSAALHDDAMCIYHYDKLTRELVSCFPLDRICVIKFEDIVQNDIIRILTTIGSSASANPRCGLRKHNERRGTRHYVNTRYAFTVGDLIHAMTGSIGIRNWIAGSPLMGFARPAIRRLSRVALGTTKVQRPTEEELQLLRVSLAEETSALGRLFGIRYE